MNKNLVWLVSYPKSGNTWFRIFLSNILFKDQGHISINEIPINKASYARSFFNEILGLDSDLFTIQEEDDLRANAFRNYAQSIDRTEYFKVHEGYHFDSKGDPVFPSDVSRGVIYIVRNPLDVAVSFSNHLQSTIDKAIENMAKQDYDLASNKGNDIRKQLSQKMSTWSNHVKGWIDQDEIPVHMIRYEDMVSKPIETFGAALDFLGIKWTDEDLSNAIRNASFDSLKNMESNEGFKEHKNTDVTFFWKGKVGNWKNYLSSEQKSRLLNDHYDVMNKLAYLDDSGEPIY